MKTVPYALALGSLMYAILCTRPNIYYVVDMVNKYQFRTTTLDHSETYFQLLKKD